MYTPNDNLGTLSVSLLSKIDIQSSCHFELLGFSEQKESTKAFPCVENISSVEYNSIIDIV